MEIPAILWQEPVLFNASVTDNLGLGRETSAEMIEVAIRKVNLGPHIESYTDTYDHQLKENGSNLSGGQKKRMDIARLLLGRSGLFILDEPTSGLDPENSKRVWSLIKEMHTGGSTVIVSTHQLDEIPRADQLLVMHEGRVINRQTNRRTFK